MRCPHCNKALYIPECAMINAEAYRGSVIVVTICCSRPVRLSANTEFHAVAYEGDAKEDDWGREIKRNEP